MVSCFAEVAAPEIPRSSDRGIFHFPDCFGLRGTIAYG
jgi:hypothetical protein